MSTSNARWIGRMTTGSGRWLALMGCLGAVLSGHGRAAEAHLQDPLQDLILYTEKYRDVVPMDPAPFHGAIARLAASVLQNTHYARLRFDDDMSARFYERYLELLDPQRFHFNQQDLKEFDRYRTTLDDLTLREGQAHAAFEIFARYLRRLEQRTAMVARLLDQGEFRFDTDEKHLLSRREEPWPASLEEARALWTRHVRYEYLQEKLGGKDHDAIVTTLSNRYKRTLRFLGEFDADDVFEIYLSALAKSYDPHTDYLGKAQLENFAISMKLSLFGIGALLRSDDGYCTIESLVPGGPAERSGRLRPKDRIVAVQQQDQEAVDVVDMKLQRVVEMIRGEKGTPVTLTIIPANAADPSERRVVTLVRDEIKLQDQQAKAELIDLPLDNGRTNRLGLIDLPSFYATVDIGQSRGDSQTRSTSEDVAVLVRKLVDEGAAGLILDLRRNGGGSLEEAIRLTGLFIKGGPIVQVRDTTGDIIIESDPSPDVLYEGPLIVLTSRFSASASEILAAALQDYDRGLVVGDKNTHGKGTVQTIFELGRSARFPASLNPGALKVTIRKFYRANGESTQKRGVQPDIVLPSVNNLLEVGEASQKHALAWDTIPGADYQPVHLIRPHLEELRRRSDARIASDPDFQYVREDMAEYERRQAARTVSLNEAVRRQEKNEADARRDARRQERAARTAPPEIRYAITLDRAAEPGLPDPVKTPTPATAESTPENDPLLAETDADPAGADADDPDAGTTVDVVLKEAKRLLADLIELTTPRTPPKATPVAVTGTP